MGYRLRMTLAFASLSVVGVVLFALLFLTSSYREFKADRMQSIERMTTCLAGNLYYDLRDGATSRVDEALARFAVGVPAPVPPVVMVVDPATSVIASSSGKLSSGGDELGSRLGSSLSLIAGELFADDGTRGTTLESAAGFIAAARIERDGNRLGTVLVDYPLSSLDEHYLNLFRAAIGYSLVLLLVMLALGWLLGRQLSRPINQLRGCMQRVGAGDLEPACTGIRTGDEIGALARGFEEMVAGLREKRLLEQEVLASERLVAMGRLAAGVAHEINNPLGGMLNAISTLKRHGSDPAVAAKTVDLIERGLRQIQSTVSALLVQARTEVHPLAPADLADLHTLITADVHKKGLRLDWHCGLEDRVPLPSGAVRQVLMNLLLNAIKAAPPGGQVTMRCEGAGEHLLLRVEDDGPGIDDEAQRHLFEPFYSATGGHGLGLWVTYQTISQLGGSIEVLPRQPGAESPGTVMEVRLPYPRSEKRRTATVAAEVGA
jgi:two-component system NtrC family sensor kinase